MPADRLKYNQVATAPALAMPAMPSANVPVLPQSKATIRPAAKPLKPACKKDCQEAAKPRSLAKGSSANRVSDGIASAMPVVYTKSGTTLQGKPGAMQKLIPKLSTMASAITI